MDSRREKVRRAERAGGVLLASRLWRLPRRTTHIVASRTKKREETRRKERSRSTGQKRNGREKRKPMRKGRATRTRETNRDGTFCSTASTSLRHSLCCVHQPSTSFFPSFLLPLVLPFLSSYLSIGFRSLRPQARANHYTLPSRTPVTFYVFILAPVCRLRWKRRWHLSSPLWLWISVSLSLSLFLSLSLSLSLSLYQRFVFWEARL